MRKSFFIAGAQTIAALALSATLASAQTLTCADVLADSTEQLGLNCAGAEPGTVCYGYPVLEAAFAETAPADLAFDTPGDIVPLTDLATLQGSEVNLETGEYGVAFFRPLANLPASLDDGLIIVTSGAVQVANAVSAEEAFVPLEDGISVTTTAAAESREVTVQSPNGSAVIGVVPANTSVVADAISADGQWVRAAFENRPVWLGVASLESDADLSSLPVFSESSRTPMQRFFVGVREDATDPCRETPNLIVVQGPERIPVDIEVNGLPVRLRSTLILIVEPSASRNALSITFYAAAGEVELDPDGDDPVTIPAGFTVTLPTVDFDLGNIDDLINAEIFIPQGTRLADLVALVPAELVELFEAIIAELPENLTNYEIPIPIIINPSGLTVEDQIQFTGGQ
jgi:hypothetical protein